MLTYIIRRLLLMIPTLAGIVFMVFMFMAYSPGGVGGPLLNQTGSVRGAAARYVREYYNKRYGLDKPPIIQFGRWLNQISPMGFRLVDQKSMSDFGFKLPDLGESMISHRPVIDVVAEALPVTVLLNLLSIPLVYTVGILSGLIAAREQGKWFDVGSGGAFLALWSVPSIWAGVMLIGLLANRQYVKLFPTAGLHEIMASQMMFLPHWTATGFQRGYLLDEMWHLVLPLVCLTYGGFAYLTKLTRGSVLDNLNADFIRTARAKGVPERDVLFRHVFRNSLLALITVAADIVPSLLGGSIVVETIFSIPGMGRLGVESVELRDREMVLAVTLVGGLIGLASQIFRDVWYAVADPRVSYEQRPTSISQPSSSLSRPPRSYSRQVVMDTMVNWGARFGVLFISVIVLAAVFAPFIANSMPLLIKSQGHWSSPLLRNLTPADVTLVVLFFAAVLLSLVRGVTFGWRVAVLVWILAVMLPLTLWATVVDNWRLWSGDWSEWSAHYGPMLLGLCLGVTGVLDLATIIAIPLLTRTTFRQRLILLIGMLGIAGALIAFPVRPPLVVVYEQYRQDAQTGHITDVVNAPLPFSPDDHLRDQPDLRLTPPTALHPMGTTANGADLASNMIHASRIALSIGFISTGISVVIGVIVGGLMGYYSGLVDLLGMRVVEIFSAIPTLLLLLCFVAFFGGNLYIIMAIIGITGWVGDAVFVRAEFLRLRQQDFVQAATACGIPLRSILFRHMLPNGLTPVIVNASFGIAGAILAESTLSFLGIGLANETSWGKLLNQALGEGGTFYWWIALYPGLAIFLTVFAYNLIGEALRDAIDPHLKKRV